jgi:3-hydroxyacyl-CoA dehydrogenase
LAKRDIQWRAMAAIVNEAAHVMAEGVALRPGDIVVALVNGYGFPRWTGGPVHWARQQDVAALAAACARAAQMAGPGHVPADLKALGITGDHRS